MILPDKWGQGALFSYSSALGECKCSHSFSARLCADSFALRFGTKNKCTMSIHADDVADVTFDYVLGDCIKARLKVGDDEFNTTLLFSSENTVLIHSDYAIDVRVGFEQPISTKKNKKCTVYSSDAECFALSCKKQNERITYAFCYGKDASDAAQTALEYSFDELMEERLGFYASLPEFKIPNGEIEKLYYRCASILFACSNSAEGIIKSRYITPAKGDMTSAYSYWSALCTLGMRHLAPDLAKDTLESILASQAGDGMISGRVSPTDKSSDINPPVLAWCFWELYQINKDKDMLMGAYAPLKKYLHYIMESRDINKNHLFEWQTGEAPEDYAIESTMDNSPRFDDGIILDCVDLSAYMANEARFMSMIAEEIDKHGESLYWDVVFERIKQAVNELLFDEDDKIYYDRAVVSNMFKKEKTSASFLPVFAGICENRHAMALLKYLNSESRFNLRYGVPSAAADSEHYCDNMWRGPMHIHHSYFIAKGLEKYEMHDKANEIKAKSLDAVMREFEKSGVLYEYYCPTGDKAASKLPKKGFSTSEFMYESNNVNIRDFAPTAAIIVDMLSRNETIRTRPKR